MTHSELNSITLCAGPCLKLGDLDVTSTTAAHLDAPLVIDSSARARDLLILAIALADDEMGWATWLDECWKHACGRQQQVHYIDELREDPCWVLIPVACGEGAIRFGWRIAGYRGETAFLTKPLGLLSDEERIVLLGWRVALPVDLTATLREALNALGRALGAVLTDEPESNDGVSEDEIFQALSVRAAAHQAEVRKD